MKLALANLLLAAAVTACGEAAPSPTPRPPCPASGPTRAQADAILAEGAAQAVVVTSKGSFTIELLPDAAPLATANFVALARCGFYDGIAFHRILAGYVIQAGDPNTDPDRPGADAMLIGSGGPGYRFEIELPPRELTYEPYTVAMANAAAPTTNGSQFFVALDDLSGRLEPLYTIFGRVVAGTEVVDEIGAAPVRSVEGDPFERIEITAIRIEGGSQGASPAAP
jgi:peptidyl-prolyl cis-trans isomerase B (cyclophilin B)